MSLIGSRVINIPGGINVKFDGKEYELEISGPKGVIKKKLYGAIINVNGDKLKVEIDNSKFEKNDIGKMHGLYNVLIKNYIEGVDKSFKKSLELIGKGYKATAISKNVIEFDLGYSHKYLVCIPNEVSFNISGDKGKNVIEISGIDNCLVGQVCSIIKSLRKVEPYKGKGFRLLGENIKLKTTKKTKK